MNIGKAFEIVTDNMANMPCHEQIEIHEQKERARILAIVDEMISELNGDMWISLGNGEGEKKRAGLQAQRIILRELKTRMEAK